jgi:hypothetical protein
MAAIQIPGFGLFTNNMLLKTESFPPTADQNQHWPLKRPV